MSEAAGFCRLDHWLWCARVARTKAVCAGFVRTGVVRVNSRPTDKPDARVRVGDVLTLPWMEEIRVVRVLAVPERRGSAEVARSFYEAVPG